VVGVAANLIALALVPERDVVAALGIGFGLANLVGTVLAWRILSRRLGGLAGREIGRSLVRMHAAAVPAALFALAVTAMIHAVLAAGKASAVLILIVGGAGSAVLYVVLARMLRVSEVTDLLRIVRTRLRR
jgi:putative peptidoglycan lipid II flippase